MIKKILFSYLTFFICIYAHSQQKVNDLQITYVANEGFLLTTSHHKILIDALFDNGYGYFSTPPKEVISKMTESNPPFDGIDLCLLTHYHGDHCNPQMLSDYLKKNPQVMLVTNKPALVFIDGCQFGFVGLKKQFCEITPEVGEVKSQVANNVPVEVLGIKHLSYFKNGIDLEEYMYNSGFYVKPDGVRIFHSGDTNLENLKDFLERNKHRPFKADVAFLQYEILSKGSDGLEYVLKKLEPKYIVLMHVPPSLNNEWITRTEQLRLVFPNIIFPTNAMDNKELKLNPIELSK